MVAKLTTTRLDSVDEKSARSPPGADAHIVCHDNMTNDGNLFAAARVECDGTAGDGGESDSIEQVYSFHLH